MVWKFQKSNLTNFIQNPYFIQKVIWYKLCRGEICVANLKAPCKWEFGQVFNGQLGHLYKLGDWKTAESWPMFDLSPNWGHFFAQSDLKKFRPNPMAGCWDNWGFIGLRVTDTQGYSVMGGWNFFVPDFNKLTSLAGGWKHLNGVWPQKNCIWFENKFHVWKFEIDYFFSWNDIAIRQIF